MGPTLETLPADAESPRLVTPQPVEGRGPLGSRPVPPATVGFSAFLDGVQRSLVFGFTADGMPLIEAKIAAVIRRRVARRLFTDDGGPLVERRMYLPRTLVPADLWAAATREGYDPRDTGAPAGGEIPHLHPHPLALQERALHLVQADRERLEQELANRWCSREASMLYIDGGLSKNEPAATSSHAVGVVKTHRTLYVAPEAIPVIARLRAGERTTAFRITSPHRAPVVSWYLRLRDPSGRPQSGPLWGLVRIEVADAAADPTARADTVSQWVMAERTPLALPDPRWPAMAYGIQDCERFLRAVV